jgi:hypothetical protein
MHQVLPYPAHKVAAPPSLTPQLREQLILEVLYVLHEVAIHSKRLW